MRTSVSLLVQRTRAAPGRRKTAQLPLPPRECQTASPWPAHLPLQGAKVFHAGTAMKDGQVVSAGARLASSSLLLRRSFGAGPGLWERGIVGHWGMHSADVAYCTVAPAAWLGRVPHLPTRLARTLPSAQAAACWA